MLHFKAQKMNNTHGLLHVEAPASPECAPPSHYMLFLLRGESYSEAQWVQLRNDQRKKVPVDFRQDSKLIREFSSNFEDANSNTYYLEHNGGHHLAATNKTSELSRGTGNSGTRIELLGGSDNSKSNVLLRSAPKQLPAGAICSAQFWARSSKQSQVNVQLVMMESGMHRSIVVADSKMVLEGGRYCQHIFGPVTVVNSGVHTLQFDLGAAKQGAVFDIDDIEVYCTKV